MEYIHSGSRSLGLIWRLNTDRILYVATIATALMAGAFIGSL